MDIPFFKSALGVKLAQGLRLFQGRSQSVLGVDLGSSSLKLVQLRREKERAVLETYGELATGPYGGAEIGKSVRLVSEKAVEMLKDILEESNATARRAVVSIPLRSSFVTMINLPIMSERELQESIPFEARRYIPVPISEVILDWWVLPEGISSEAGKEEGFVKERKFSEILLVAIHRETVDKYQDIFRQAGMEVASFEIEVFSQTRSALFREVAPTLLVDCGASATRFTLVDFGVVRLSHSLDKGSQDLTNALSRSLGVEFSRAEQMKREVGFSGRPEHKELVAVIQPLVDHIFSDGVNVVSEYRRRSNRSLRKVLLTGGGANLKGLGDFVINKFGVEAGLAHPFSRVFYPAFLEPALKELGPSFSTAAGLALREFQA